MKTTPDIAIIGPGKVGAAIGILAVRAGWRVAAVGGRDLAKAQSAVRAIGPSVEACGPAQAAAKGRLVLLTVSDEAIASVCDALAATGAFEAGAVVAHCSGVLDSSVLDSARRAGCHVGSMHPLQTFPSAQAAVEKMAGAYCFIEGDAEAAAVLEDLARDIGGKGVHIAASAKPLYHASAVMACNYVAALLDAALALCGAAGIDAQTAGKALGPLVRATVDNCLAAGAASALTGPIARGDVATVRRHLEALAGSEADLDEFYRSAGKWTVGLAQRKGTLDAAAAKRLRELLDSPFKKE
ncbi:MAG: DUF2520 domain-containing protein [Phycisphaerae bacterium]|jgi:predicted short-subunit dehydrogenase-like oxidoreductase (DUF2520 family)